MRYLLDTNVMIAWMVRSTNAVVRQIIANQDDIAIPSMAIHELYFGAFNSARIAENIVRLIDIGWPIFAFDEDDARVAGEIRAVLKQRGTPIGPYDLLIAGQALARDLTLVTNNVREFARVEGLRVVDWTQG